jgi:Holliday junction resolvase-like predicted endonuclease
METKFASTSLKRYYTNKKAKGKEKEKEKIKRSNNDLRAIASLIAKGDELWQGYSEGLLTKTDTYQSEDKNNKKKDVSIFDICRIENNENCFSNALAHFMDKYRREWCTIFFKNKGITLNENFEIFREVDATIPKNNNNETENSGGSNKKGGRIDILLKDNKNIIIIENKIKSDINGVKGDVGEGKQLERYQDYAHWLKFQPELDKIKDELQKLYVNSDSFYVHQGSGEVQITKKQGKKDTRHRTQAEDEGKEKWREFIGKKIEALDVHLFVLSPNYNIPHIPKSCEDWEIITYKDISIFLENEFTLSEDTNLEDFYNVMQRHICENLCDWLRIDMREKFIARINKLK